MPTPSTGGRPLSARLADLDARLLAVPRSVQRAAIVFTALVMAAECLPYVPRAYVDYSSMPFLQRIKQNDTYGTDTISDMYEAKVILNAPSDMYTKDKLDQTPLEAATWSKAASGPYLPAVLLSEAGLYFVGERTGVKFYGMIVLLACLFLGLSAWYFLQTRWYLFPVLYLNFFYVGYRFVYVQDDTYLVMLVVVMAALLLARARRPAAHLLMALAIDMKLTPLYYTRNLPLMRGRVAALFVAILAAGLLLPYVVWDNYFYIFRFHEALKGDRYGAVAAVAYGVPFAVLLAYIEAKLGFDMEDRIGWGMVPFAMCLAMKMNVSRHLVIALLVPDKRGLRNLAAAVPLALNLLLPGVVRFGSVLSLATVLLFGILFHYLRTIGWQTVLDDFKHPFRTAKLVLSGITSRAPAES
jgi:hypothetical protein